MPSGFLSGDFYETGGGNERTVLPNDFGFLEAVAGNENAFLIAASDLVVNGWQIRFEYSDTASDGQNLIYLEVPPVVGTRADAIILEVWRALVTADDASGKSPSGQIFRHGNAKAPDAIGNQNLADDLIDPTYARPTQARVQIQYRYRVVTDWDFGTHPELPDAVEANCAAYASGSSADGVGTGLLYGRVASDPGLWRVGSGDAASAAALGTVDGYMYAVPVCAVFRRNSGAFDKDININGGAALAAGTPDRPDGQFVDHVHAGDVLDLRKAAATDLQEALTRNFSHLMRDELVTNAEVTADDCAGTAVFMRDRLVSPGAGVPDGVRYDFSDRATLETVVAAVTLADTGGAAHTQADFELSVLSTTWGVVDLTAVAPAGTEIVGVKKLWTVFPDGTADPRIANQWCMVSNIVITGSRLTLLLADSTGGQEITFFAELEIKYPAGSGALSRVPLEVYSVWAPVDLAVWADPSTVSALPDASRVQLDRFWSVSAPNRGLRMAVMGMSESGTFAATTDGTEVWLPQKLNGADVVVDDGVNPVYLTSNYTQNTVATVVTLSHQVAGGSGVRVEYVPIRPAPLVVGDSYEVFYRARALQSVGVPAGVRHMRLQLRAAPAHLTVVTAGTASPDDMLVGAASTGFFQIPLGTRDSDSVMQASVSPKLSSARPMPTGFASLPVSYSTMLQNQVVVQNNDEVTHDADGRSFWPRVSNAVFAAAAPQLACDSIHKTLHPVLMEVVDTNTDSIRPGTLVLAVFTEVGSTLQPSVTVNTFPSAGCVAIYRLRGNLMHARRAT